MTCSDLHDLISAYVDGEIQPAQRELIEIHLEWCASCQTYLIGHQRVRQLLIGWPGLQITPDIGRVVGKRLQVELGKQASRSLIHKVRDDLHQAVVPFSLAVTLIIGVVIGHAGSTIAPVRRDAQVSPGHAVQSNPISTPALSQARRLGAIHRASVRQEPDALLPYIKVETHPAHVGRQVARVIVKMSLPDRLSAAELPVEVHQCTSLDCVQNLVRTALNKHAPAQVKPAVAPIAVRGRRNTGMPQMA